MATAPATVEGAFSEALRRARVAWNDFFFKPRDPTTLGLMRICAGIFILYVHLAHTPDLYNFFGPKGWSDQELTYELRKEYPFFQPNTSWTENQWRNFVPPLEKQVREIVLRKWVQELPTDPAARKEALRYLSEIPVGAEPSYESLAFAEQLMIRPSASGTRLLQVDYRLAAADERQKMLDALTRPTIGPAERDLVPKHLHTAPLEKREEVRRSVLAFVGTFKLTGDNKLTPGHVAVVIQHLSYHAMLPIAVRKSTDPRTELARTLIFLTEQEDPAHPDDERGPFLPNNLEERRQVLDYMTTWAQDPRRTYGKGQYIWSVWFHITDPTAMAAVHVAFLIAMAMFAAGLFTRITAVVTWIGILSYINRCNQMVFGMDTMMNIATIYLMIGPSGATLSLDRWLEKRRAARELEKARREKRDTREFEAILAGPRPTVLANFVTRLVQIHFCFIYAASGLSKLKGTAWWNHSAVWYTIANPEFSPTVFQPYLWSLAQLSGFRWLAEGVMSFGTAYTLFLEIAFPFLVWRPLLRPYMVMLAVLLHTGIAVFMGLTVFGLFMLVLLMSYIPPEAVKRWVELGERRLRRQSPPAPVAATPVPAKV